MGCLKLHIEENYSALKVVHRAVNPVQKVEQAFFFSPEKTDAGEYCYGFNGKELDPEGMGGGGSTYDYGFRIYNPSLARFLSLDPLSRAYPFLTPYQFAANSPIMASDLDGLEANVEIIPQNNNDKPTLKMTIYLQIENQSDMTQDQINAYVVGAIEKMDKSYSGTISYKGVEFNVETSVFVNTAEKKFSLTFKNIGSDYEVLKNGDTVLGEADAIGYTQENNSDVYVGPINEEDKENGIDRFDITTTTIAHEKGHEMGAYSHR